MQHVCCTLPTDSHSVDSDSGYAPHFSGEIIRLGGLYKPFWFLLLLADLESKCVRQTHAVTVRRLSEMLVQPPHTNSHYLTHCNPLHVIHSTAFHLPKLHLNTMHHILYTSIYHLVYHLTYSHTPPHMLTHTPPHILTHTTSLTPPHILTHTTSHTLL